VHDAHEMPHAAPAVGNLLRPIHIQTEPTKIRLRAVSGRTDGSLESRIIAVFVIAMTISFARLQKQRAQQPIQLRRAAAQQAECMDGGDGG
jgi:hypothetical protein